MTINGLTQIGLFCSILVALVKPLGWYMAEVYRSKPFGLDHIVSRFERRLYRLAGVRPDEEMEWRTYALAM